MFTDRFIKVPISVFNIKQKELTGVEILEPGWFKFSPLALESYMTSYTEEDPDKKLVSITLRNGDSTLIDLSMEEFEKLLNEHQK